ncbi:hypothetical protein K493DRAFT_58136 [Basidiobolus meristosporus CBS 931.73]|uniref:BZIP domain-containing protein n=1 Tax=Basidiobolus meristosporus CBS 931.73 TaxID=1314790 RepID=A0A1Y1WBU4_9FUNG|nr:hypothetical protein K493DRAFT_4735 [Basidiobolus meristosporus CBS 931.73]ORX90558.1 hypothetical protein K493DRAFT_58136 [Basidiobolus meristosporus CBS 931.73]|eukprot:ORX71019.1 hypothetical protein K493DRAFT_4735 [Basidiobolus meristosporus CBS 931.73]
MPVDKRKAQNRAAQRAFRERKDNYLKELETRVKELEESNDKNSEENAKLRKILEEVKAENVLLKGNFTFQPPNNALDGAPTLVDLLKNADNSQSASPIFSPATFPWTPTSNSGEINFIHNSQSPENLGLSSSDDRSPFNEASPHILQIATPKTNSILNPNQQPAMFQQPIHESSFFAPIGEIVDDPLISVPQEFASPQIYDTTGEPNLNLPFSFSDYRDPSAGVYDENIAGDLSALPVFYEEGWNDEFNEQLSEQLFSPVQTSSDVANVADSPVLPAPEVPGVSPDDSEIHISLEDCKVLEHASLPLDFDISLLCDALRKKATCGGRVPCPEKADPLAQL